jgi:hypothetical protein
MPNGFQEKFAALLAKQAAFKFFDKNDHPLTPELVKEFLDHAYAYTSAGNIFNAEDVLQEIDTWIVGTDDEDPTKIVWFSGLKTTALGRKFVVSGTSPYTTKAQKMEMLSIRVRLSDPAGHYFCEASGKMLSALERIGAPKVPVEDVVKVLAPKEVTQTGEFTYTRTIGGQPTEKVMFGHPKIPQEGVTHEPLAPVKASLFHRKAKVLPAPEMILAYSGAEKERSIWYHGTTADNLRSIMAHGLIPMVKEKRNWDSDENSGIHTPSRESYGGTYVTRNLSTATSAPRNRKINTLVVVMHLQPRTFIADEDDYAGRLNDVLGHLTDSSYHVPMIWLAANADPAELGHGWQTDVNNYRTAYVERKLKYLNSQLGSRLDHPQLLERITGLLEDAWMAGLTRLTAHHVKTMKDYDQVRQYQQVFPEATRDIDDAGWEVLKAKIKAIWPSVEEGEAAYRRVIDKITRTLKAAARPEVSQETFAPTARVMEPIGFRGANKIIAVVEILPRQAGSTDDDYARVSENLFGTRDTTTLSQDQYQQVAQQVIREQNEPTTPLVLHYGKLPEDFIQQWRERKGGTVEIRTKAASMVYASETDIPAVITKFMPYLTPGLPRPNVRVVNSLGTSWLARDLWVPGEGNTTIEIQKAVVNDRQTLERIIAHELVHHDIFLTEWLPLSGSQNLNQLMKIEGGHGHKFKTKADGLNAIFGADFVTETSDSAMVEEEAGTPYYVLLKLSPPGQISWAYCVRPSTRQRAYIEDRIVTGVVPGQFKLVKTRDRVWAQGAAIGKGFATTWDKGLGLKLQDLWEHSEPLSKVAATAYDLEDATGRVVKIELTPRLGYHYTIFATPVEDGYEAEMHRADGTDLPPYKMHGKTIGEFTKACWSVLDEGYRTLIDAARRTGDKTRASQLFMEHRHEQQVLMADIEQAFRELPPGPRPDWSKPWEHAPKEGSVMAQMKRNTSKAQFADKFKAMFPQWSVEVTGSELMAISPTNMDWAALRASTEKLRDLGKSEGVVICAQPRSGRSLITIDLSGLI